ncbi:MAG: hypothetical protein ACRCT7_17630 [Shewanella sp.]|uniref:hypothetical protein n=1 Tax=Shewanella sp. SNU WT4 TaxID=2590015 RepID=UPI0011286CF8|nr:hypothetical protein [Shewanella sp. SNU WT4]QDF68256.1 hypothetical protein FJQ87_17650 [Shewanella sp. SNU WT4]
MYNTAKKQVWFGELRTSRGNSVVVHDNQLPDASPGRIYLFNAQRNTIIEYVEDIVKVNLYELEGDALSAAQTQYGAAWKEARAAFMVKHRSLEELEENAYAAPARKAKPEPEPEPEVEGLGDDFEDWADDFDD